MNSQPFEKVLLKLTLIVAVATVAMWPAETKAQESELKVIDEVVAQVNDEVITLSRIKREVETAIQGLIEQGKTREAATTDVKGREGELIADLINQALLLQKGKDLGVEADADAQVNQRFLEFMKQQNLKTLDALYKEMEKQGFDPQDVRENWKRGFMRDIVMQREVESKTYWGWSPKEVRAYFEKNKTRFLKPEKVTLSEIFLSFAGRDESAVREKAKQILEKLREGADFGLMAVANSDRPEGKDSKGDLGVVTMTQLREVNEAFVGPLTATKVGGFTDAIETSEGIEIFKVSAREEASKEAVFEEGEVRRAMTIEVIAEKRKEFMVSLRSDAYIKISESYRPIVSPVLFADERKAESKKPGE